MAIRSYLDGRSAFEPEHVAAMSAALDDACRVINVPANDTAARQTIAARIIDLARNGVIDAKTSGNSGAPCRRSRRTSIRFPTGIRRARATAGVHAPATPFAGPARESEKRTESGF